MTDTGALEGASNEAFTRPEDRDENSTRGRALDSEIGLPPKVRKAKEKLKSGEGTVEQVNEAAGTRR